MVELHEAVCILSYRGDRKVRSGEVVKKGTNKKTGKPYFVVQDEGGGFHTFEENPEITEVLRFVEN